MNTRYLNLKDAATYLGRKERFMRRLVFERRIRFYKVGKFVHFDKGDLDAFTRCTEPVRSLTEVA